MSCTRAALSVTGPTAANRIALIPPLPLFGSVLPLKMSVSPLSAEIVAPPGPIVKSRSVVATAGPAGGLKSNVPPLMTRLPAALEDAPSVLGCRRFQETGRRGTHRYTLARCMYFRHCLERAGDGQRDGTPLSTIWALTVRPPPRLFRNKLLPVAWLPVVSVPLPLIVAAPSRPREFRRW